MSSIPTTYNGVRFRSRLEARWAAWFDLKGDCRWEYEPIDLNGWIPDFALYVKGTEKPALVEIKPVTTFEQFTASGENEKILTALVRDAKERITDSYCTIMVLGINPDIGWILKTAECGCQPEIFFTPLPEANDPHNRAAWREAGNRTQWKPPRLGGRK
jgi:hypothetical protein